MKTKRAGKKTCETNWGFLVSFHIMPNKLSCPSILVFLLHQRCCDAGKKAIHRTGFSATPEFMGQWHIQKHNMLQPSITI